MKTIQRGQGGSRRYVELLFEAPTGQTDIRSSDGRKSARPNRWNRPKLFFWRIPRDWRHWRRAWPPLAGGLRTRSDDAHVSGVVRSDRRDESLPVRFRERLPSRV